MYDSLSSEQYQTLASNPRAYVSTFWRHPNDPDRKYDFRTTDGEDKLNYLLHDDGPLNPESWGNINILKFARGCLKTTSVTAIANWAHHMFLPYGIRGYMTAPREKPPIKGFMGTFDEKVRQSGLDQFRVTDNEKYQEFEIERQDESGNTFPVKSVLEADSGYNADTLRGPHSHYGIIDEFQDIGKVAFDTFSHCIDQKVPDVDYFPAIFIIGTPKKSGSWYHELWEKTDQRTWNPETRTWMAESDPQVYRPDKDVLEEAGLDPDSDDIPQHTVRGWHIDQYASPLHSAADIARDKDGLSPQQFANEVEAVFRDPENNLLSDEIVQEKLFDESRRFRDSPITEESYVTLGCDWGGGGDRKAADTVISVVEWLDREGERAEGQVLMLDPLDHSFSASEEVQEVEKALSQYDVDLAVVDHGHGYKSVEDLQDGTNTIDSSGYIDRVKACRFGNIANKSETKWESTSGMRRFFTVDKTHMTDRFVETVTDGRLTLPAANLDPLGQDGAKGRKIIDHLTAPYKDLDTTVTGRKKTKVQIDDSRHDDIFDSLLYNVIAHDEVQVGFSMSASVGMSKRKGAR